MRKSINSGDPDYDPSAWKYRVFLDGVEIFNCHTADDEIGICYCYEDCEVAEDCRGYRTVERRGVVKLVKTDNDHYR